MVDFDGSGLSAHRAEQNGKLLSYYVNAPQKEAELLTKAEFVEKFPEDKFAFYNLDSLHKLRTDLKNDLKKGGEAADTSDETFRELTKNLKRYFVTGDGKTTVIFVDEKVKA